jgi:hypothetical protein
MRLSDFKIGMEVWMSGSRWRCTDIGTRLVIAIKLDHDDDPSWYDGPPYAVCEHTIDLHDFAACSLTRYEGNSESYTDEEVERIRNWGMANIVEYRPEIPPEVLEHIKASRAHAARRGKVEMDNSDKEQIAQPDQDEDEGIDYKDIPQITDFSQTKRVSDYGTVVDALRIRYQEKMARAAKVAAEQKKA